MNIKKILFIIIGLFLFSNVLAEMQVNEPKEIYNIGEKLYISINDIKGSSEGNLNINLICGNNTINLLKISARAFSSDTKQSYSLPYKILTKDDLEIDDINKIIGKCKVIVSLNSESVKTKDFQITNLVKINSNINKLTYTPGETISIDIASTNSNGEAFNGKYEISNFSFIKGDLINGKASAQIMLDEKQKSGTYLLNIIVYDEDSKGEILNNNSKIEYFVVSQKATSVNLGISNTQLNPGEKLKINPELFDQANDLMQESITIYLESPKGEVRISNIDSGETEDIDFLSNDSMGIWNVYAFFGNIYSQKYEVTLNCLPKLNYEVVGGLLNISNVGNCLYQNLLNISIGNKDYSIDLKLLPQTTKQFNIQAPDGDYDILISSDNEENSFSGTTFLTGNSISIKDLSEKSTNLFIYLFVLIFVIFVILALFYTKNKKIKIKNKSINKKNFSIKNFVKMINFSKRRDKKEEKRTEDNFISDKKELTAESTLVLNGEKMNSSIISINIKNNNELNEEIKKKLLEIIKDMSKKSTIDIKDDYLFLIFNPLITKTYKNEMNSVQVALNLIRELSNYNRKYKTKIDFGISVHSGDLIAQKDKEILKYTGVGDTLSFSKKMSNLSDGKLFVSDIVRKKLIRDLKVIKETRINNQDVYSVSEIKNIEANKSKLDDLLKRMN